MNNIHIRLFRYFILIAKELESRKKDPDIIDAEIIEEYEVKLLTAPKSIDIYV